MQSFKEFIDNELSEKIKSSDVRRGGTVTVLTMNDGSNDLTLSISPSFIKVNIGSNYYHISDDEYKAVIDAIKKYN